MDTTASIETLTSVAPLFRLDEQDSLDVLREVLVATSRWREMAAERNIPKVEIDQWRRRSSTPNESWLGLSPAARRASVAAELDTRIPVAAAVSEVSAPQPAELPTHGRYVVKGSTGTLTMRRACVVYFGVPPPGTSGRAGGWRCGTIPPSSPAPDAEGLTWARHRSGPPDRSPRSSWLQAKGSG